ncbi:hypothetical protein EBS43_05730 [bacterium]|nr:hypothetical protein [bacterium]
MKYGLRKSLIICLCFLVFGAPAQASIVNEIVTSLATDFVEVTEPASVTESGGGVAVAPAPSVGGEEDVPSRSSVWLSKKPVSQHLFVKVLGNNPSAFKEAKFCSSDHVSGAQPMCPHLAVDGVRYYSVGERNSIDEFLDALNDLARAEVSPYRFRLPVEEELLRSVDSKSLILTGLPEWTASRARAPYISKLVVQYKPFHLKSASHQEVLFDSVSAAQLERKYLHPEFFSEKTRLSFRIIVETKPAIASALHFEE